MEQIDAGHEVEGSIGIGQVLGIAGDERHVAIGLEMLPRFFEIGGREVEARCTDPRKGLLDEAQEPAGAAGTVEQPHLALVAPL